MRMSCFTDIDQQYGLYTGGQINVHTSSHGVETLKAEKMVELFTGQDRPHH